MTQKMKKMIFTKKIIFLLLFAFLLTLPLTWQALTEQRFELKEREKAISVAENLAHSLHCYCPK